MRTDAKWTQESERIIYDLVRRKDAAEEDSPEYNMAIRQLRGLRYSYEEAGGIIEEADPIGWPAYCRPPE